MRRAIVLMCLLARVNLEMLAVQRYFISRKTRSSSAPVTAGYAFSQTNGPAVLDNFQSIHADSQGKGHGTGVTNATVSEAKKLMENSGRLKDVRGYNSSSGDIATPALRQVWSETDAPRKLKLAASRMVKSYDSVFRADDEDIRTDFKNSYDSWPFLYQNLFEYEPKKFNIEVEKAKDKRFAIPTVGNIIPVHEKVEEMFDDENLQNKIDSEQDYKNVNAATSDNPIFGNQPFFSYILNDYFDKTEKDDPSTFEGFSWGKEFDHEMALQDMDDYAKRIRRLEGNSPASNSERNEKKSNALMEHDAMYDSLNTKGRDTHRESESSEKGDNSIHNYDGSHHYDGENYRGFKEFADSFAHRFGSEDHDRASNYAKKNNTDKGENNKGFRTIHHKDEYQEHRDFFDNMDNSENVEEKGTSKVHIGGSEALLRSLAGAATGSDKNKLVSSENIEKKQFERDHADKLRHSETDRELDQYRDVAKRTALNNNADYVERYVM